MGSVNQNESVRKPVSAFCFYEFREMLVTRCSHPTMFGQIPVFGMLPKFSDRYAWANSADPDQTSSLIRVYTVCHSVCIVWTHYSMVEPHSSNFRVITTTFGVSEYLGNLRYNNVCCSMTLIYRHIFRDVCPYVPWQCAKWHQRRHSYAIGTDNMPQNTIFIPIYAPV